MAERGAPALGLEAVIAEGVCEGIGLVLGERQARIGHLAVLGIAARTQGQHLVIGDVPLGLDRHVIHADERVLARS